MFKAFSKVILITLMLIAFTGQAFAFFSMSCEMSNGSNESHMSMEHSKMNHHEGMKLNNVDEAGNHLSMDCCGDNCVCPTNGCTSTLVINSSIDSTDIQLLSEAIALLQSEQPNSIFTSLYRPPILA